MGYTTEFQGQLSFTKELTVPEIRKLNTILGQDLRDIPKYSKSGLYYVQFELTKNLDGLKWDGTEKFYEAEKVLQTVIDYMREDSPDFGLSGYLSAQGEDIEDCWRLEIKDGKAVKVMTPPNGKKITCPHCDESFYIDCK